MRDRSFGAVSSLGLLVATALGALAVALSAEPRPANAQAGASASASPSTSTSASAAPPPLPTVRGADLPAERSSPPTPAEWKGAREVALHADLPRKPCSAKLLREYLRVTCPDLVGVGLVAGDPKDVRVWVQSKFGWDEKLQKSTSPTALADVPIRAGESTVVNFTGLDGGGYDSVTVAETATLIVSWRRGAPDPWIVLAEPAPGVE